MNNELWNNIQKFEFDNPISEYGFSTRLANENFWTENFTQTAILEYKKFMYLASTANHMVSPSEIVDIVWHQHLIFTQSYSDFCTILGKRIEHVPSTHNKQDVEKFKLAKEKTALLYASIFGEHPQEIWDFSTIYEPLSLSKAGFKIRSFLIFGIIAFLFLIYPVYFLISPVFSRINNPYFIRGYIVLVVAIFLVLEIYNRSKLFS